MSRPRMGDWPRLTADHRAAADRFVARATGLSDLQWTRPWAPDRWTCAEVVEHVILSYELVGAELHGGPPMKVVVPLHRRLVLRWAVWPRLLAGRFPERAPAPRELRPAKATDPAPQRETLARLTAAVDGFETAIEAARAAGSPRAITHPYFGRIPLPEVLAFLAAHTSHHAAQLAAAPAPAVADDPA